MPDLTELVDRLLRWLEPLYQQYGYIVVLLGAMLEHTFFLAWALPGGILVAIGGFYSGSGLLRLPLVMLCAIVGFMVGDHLDYLVGRRGQGMLRRVARGRTMPASYVWSWRAIPALILAYTNTIPRAAMFMGGAASGLPYHQFLTLSFSLAVFWSATNTLLGYWLGSNREFLESTLRTIGIGGQLLLVLIVCGAFLYYRYKQRRRRKPEEAAERETSAAGRA